VEWAWRTSCARHLESDTRRFGNPPSESRLLSFGIRMDHSTIQLSSPTLASLFTGGPPLAPTSDDLPEVVDTPLPTAFKVVLGKARPRGEAECLEQLPRGHTWLGMKRTQEVERFHLIGICAIAINVKPPPTARNSCLAATQAA
jgi:hypothetical protein